MKPVLLIASTYAPPICGGAEWVAWEVAKRIADRFELHMLTTGEGSPEIRELIEFHRVPRTGRMSMAYSTIYRNRVEKIIRNVSPNLIHCHMVLPWGYVLRNARAAKVITSHATIEPTGVARYFMRSALSHADAVTSPSRWETEYLQEEYGRKTVTIPNGVETGLFKVRPEIAREENVVLYVGRFTRNKGALDLIEAARVLPEYEFWFRGSAEPPNVGREGVTIPSLPNVRVIDFMSDRQALAALYNQATICAFPSQYENFPLVGLEAMACGRTFVATMGPRNGYSDYVENGKDALLVNPHDINALVKSIRYLMENKSARDEFERNARKKALQYDWEIIAEKYKALLEGLSR